jgi:antitoxin (DNA-binding transcriptional repressor) of toxin-antitoxin stability system
MSAPSVDFRELATRFPELLSGVSPGSEIIVTENDVPRARLIPLPRGGARTPGLHPNSMTAADDFDAPLGDEFWTGSS